MLEDTTARELQEQQQILITAMADYRKTCDFSVVSSPISRVIDPNKSSRRCRARSDTLQYVAKAEPDPLDYMGPQKSSKSDQISSRTCKERGIRLNKHEEANFRDVTT